MPNRIHRNLASAAEADAVLKKSNVQFAPRAKLNDPEFGHCALGMTKAPISWHLCLSSRRAQADLRPLVVPIVMVIDVAQSASGAGIAPVPVNVSEHAQPSVEFVNKGQVGSVSNVTTPNVGLIGRRV